MAVKIKRSDWSPCLLWIDAFASHSLLLNVKTTEQSASHTKTSLATNHVRARPLPKRRKSVHDGQCAPRRQIRCQRLVSCAPNHTQTCSMRVLLSIAVVISASGNHAFAAICPCFCFSIRRYWLGRPVSGRCFRASAKREHDGDDSSDSTITTRNSNNTYIGHSC